MKTFFEKHFGGFFWLLVALFLVIVPTIWAKNTMLDLSLIPRHLALCIMLLLLSTMFFWLIIRKKFTFYFNNNDKIIFGALGIYMLIHVISSFGVINYQEAVYRSLKEYSFVFWLFFIYQLLRYQPKGREVLIKSVIVMGSIFLGIGIYQLISSDFTEFKQATGNQGYYLNQIMNNVFSTCSNKNLFAEILFLLLPFSIYGFIIYKKFWRVVSMISALLNLGFIVILFTRSVFVSLTFSGIVTGILLVIYFFRVMPKQGKEVPEWIKISFVGIPLTIIVTLVILLSSTNFQVIEVFKEKIEVTFNSKKYANINVDNPSSTQSRLIAWGKTIEMIKEHPLLGVGPGQWQILMPKYGLDQYENNVRQGTLLWQRPHSDMLWIGSEVGLLGLLCYLIFYFGAIVIGIRNFIRSDDNRVRIFNLLAAVALIGWLVDLSTNYPHERIEHNLLYMLLAAVIFSDVLGKHQPISENSVTPKLKWLILLFLPIIVFNTYVTYQFYQGEMVARKIKVANMRKDWNKVIREAKKTEGTFYTLDNFTTPIYYYKGLALAAVKNYNEAHKALQKSYELNPYHLQTLNNYATSFDLTGNRDMAIKYYNEALAVSPRYKEPIVNLAIVYFNTNDLATALKYIASLPYDLATNPEKYKVSYITICRKMAYVNKLKYNEAKFNEWIQNEDRITETFLRYKNAGGDMENILLAELR